jgi:hypothetical protein
MKDIESSRQGIPRRTLLKSLPAIAGLAAALGAAASDHAIGQIKLAHKQAKYRDTPKNGRQCSSCVNSCRLVASPISPKGRCQFYVEKTSG